MSATGSDPAATAAPASIVWRGRLDWAETDAAGIAHWTAVFRLVERAEAALFTALDHAEVFGIAPRTDVAVRYRGPLRFNDEVVVELAVTKVGASTVRYSFLVSGPEGVTAEGKLGACIIDPQTFASVRMSDELRERLAGAGAQ